MDENLNCSGCGCAWDAHRFVPFSQHILEMDFADPGIVKQIKTLDEKKTNILLNKFSYKNVIKNAYSELKNSFYWIIKAAGAILVNSIFPFNDAMKDFLKENVVKSLSPENDMHLSTARESLKTAVKQKIIFIQCLQQLDFDYLLTVHNNAFSLSAITSIPIPDDLMRQVFYKTLNKYPPSMKEYFVKQIPDETPLQFLNYIISLSKSDKPDERDKMMLLLFFRGLKDEAMQNYILSLENPPNTFIQIRGEIIKYLDDQKKPKLPDICPENDSNQIISKKAQNRENLRMNNISFRNYNKFL